MGMRLGKAPVCFTLAQMRFNPMLAMDAILPALQEAFRTAGFPDFSQTTVQALELSASPTGMDVRQREVSRFVFGNRTQTAAVLLDPGALTYELTDYPDFDAFSATFLNALEIVHRHRAIEYSDWLGIRMLDAVQPLEGDRLEKYLAPQALGFLDLIKTPFEHRQTLTESLFQDGAHTLVVRSVRLPQGMAVPPDLAPLRLKLAERFESYRGETVMLDCDSARTERRMDFSVEQTRTELARLKSALSISFKALVTPYALEVWK